MKKVLIFGGSGMVGSRFIQQHKDSFEISAPSIEDVDIVDKNSLLKVYKEFSPDVVLNYAAYTNVEEAEKQKDDKNGICYLINVTGAENIAKLSKDFGVHMIHISTEYVFNGQKSDVPYKEEDKMDAINWYGKTKQIADEKVLSSGCKFTIARISMPYCVDYPLKKDVARYFLSQLKQGLKIQAIDGQKITPTFVDDLALAFDLIIKEAPSGTYHLSVIDNTTPFEFAKKLATEFSLDTNLIEKISFDEYNSKKSAKLLKNSWLDSSKFIREFGSGILKSIDQNIKEFKRGVDALVHN